MLKVQDLISGYGKVQIINGVNMMIEKGEIVALIGRNGVGKSTFIKTVMGLLPVLGGKIYFHNEEDLTKVPAYKRARKGLAYVPQGHGIFPRLTVEENLMTGALINVKKKEESYERIYETFPLLGERKKQLAGTMSGGEQAMLSLGRVLVNQPEIILLDEPSEGVQPNIVDEMGDIIMKVSGELGLTVLLVEQHLDLIQKVAGRAYVMDKGTIVTGLTKDQIHEDDTISRYLAV